MKKTIILLAIILSASATAQTFEPIPFDKKWHIAAGAFAGTWGTVAGNSMEWSAEESALFGVAMSAVAGVGKEFMDVAPIIFGNKSARFDVMDIAATVEGGIIGAGLSYLALKIFKKKTVLYGDINNGFIVGVKVQL